MNLVILTGRVGKDAERNTTTSGVSVAKFTLATTERLSKEKEITEWHTIRCWRATADFAEKYIKKGALVCVEGHLRTEKWERDGEKHQQTIVEVENIDLLSRPTDKGSGNGRADRIGRVTYNEIAQRGNDRSLEPQSNDLPF